MLGDPFRATRDIVAGFGSPLPSRLMPFASRSMPGNRSFFAGCLMLVPVIRPESRGTGHELHVIRGPRRT